MQPLGKVNQIKLYQLIKIAEEFVQYGEKEIYEKISNVELEVTDYVHVALFGRNLFRIDTIAGLMKTFESKPTVEDSIGLLVRAGLADILSFLYINEHHKKVVICPSPEEDKYKAVAKAYLADHIYSQVKFIKDARDSEYYTKERYVNILDLLKTKLPTYFKKESFDYTKPKTNIDAEEFPTPSGIVKLLRKVEDERIKFDINNVYELYSKYSKYEHFGIFTNDFQNANPNELFTNMIIGLDYMLWCTALCSSILSRSFNLQLESNKLLELKENYNRITKLGI